MYSRNKEIEEPILDILRSPPYTPHFQLACYKVTKEPERSLRALPEGLFKTAAEKEPDKPMANFYNWAFLESSAMRCRDVTALPLNLRLALSGACLATGQEHNNTAGWYDYYMARTYLEQKAWERHHDKVLSPLGHGLKRVSKWLTQVLRYGRGNCLWQYRDNGGATNYSYLIQGYGCENYTEQTMKGFDSPRTTGAHGRLSVCFYNLIVLTSDKNRFALVPQESVDQRFHINILVTQGHP